MSNILLVIGNGFDIECGLSSRYIDFYEQVIKREGQLKWHEQTRPRDFWHILLRCYANINDVQNKNWCDIERIIKKTLALIFIPTNPIKETLFDVAYQHGIGPSRVSFITKYNGAPINHFIANYCGDFIASYFFNVKGNINVHLVSQNIVKNELTRHLFQELNHLEKDFCEYIRQVVGDDYISKSSDLVRNLCGFQQDLVKGIIPDMSGLSIINFNYTVPIITKAYNLRMQKNVHGKLCEEQCEKCNGSSTIFGIDDAFVNKQNNDSIKPFSKTYRALNLEEYCSINLPIESSANPLTIIFYGHSLDEGDYSYFQSIFDSYSIYDNKNISLLFYYHAIDAKNNMTEKVYNLINQYGKTLQNKDQGNNMIHKLLLENRISIKLYERKEKYE